MASSANELSQNNAIGSGKKVAFAALHHRDFRIYFVTTMLAMMADNIEHVISYWLFSRNSDRRCSPVLPSSVHWTPFLFFSVYFGAMADRYDCRKVIQIAQIMYMGVSAAWAFLFFTDTIQIWHACVLLVIHGMAGVLWAPGSQLLIHDIVGSEQLTKRGTTQLHESTTGSSFWPGSGRRTDAAFEPADGAGGEYAYLFAIDPVVADGALYRP